MTHIDQKKVKNVFNFSSLTENDKSKKVKNVFNFSSLTEIDKSKIVLEHCGVGQGRVRWRSCSWTSPSATCARRAWSKVENAQLHIHFFSTLNASAVTIYTLEVLYNQIVVQSANLDDFKNFVKIGVLRCVLTKMAKFDIFDFSVN
jgi:hypothetical protein